MRLDESRLVDMINAIQTIRTYIGTLTFESFSKNPMVCDAVIRQIEILGEAASHVSAEYKQSHPEIPWRKMIDTRNVLIHQYDEVDLQQVWNIAVVHAPDVFEKLKPS
jgi:uncharacterized protein with HEPN domain